MQNFLRQTRAYKTINFDDDDSSNNWTLVAVILVASVFAIIVIVRLIVRKRYLNQIIGKRLANVHDLEKVNVKQTPICGEEMEMSALVKKTKRQ